MSTARQWELDPTGAGCLHAPCSAPLKLPVPQVEAGTGQVFQGATWGEASSLSRGAEAAVDPALAGTTWV